MNILISTYRNGREVSPRKQSVLRSAELPHNSPPPSYVWTEHACVLYSSVFRIRTRASFVNFPRYRTRIALVTTDMSLRWPHILRRRGVRVVRAHCRWLYLRASASLQRLHLNYGVHVALVRVHDVARSPLLLYVSTDGFRPPVQAAIEIAWAEASVQALLEHRYPRVARHGIRLPRAPDPCARVRVAGRRGNRRHQSQTKVRSDIRLCVCRDDDSGCHLCIQKAVNCLHVFDVPVNVSGRP